MPFEGPLDDDPLEEAVFTSEDQEQLALWAGEAGLVYDTPDGTLCVSSDQQIMWKLVVREDGVGGWVTWGSL